MVTYKSLTVMEFNKSFLKGDVDDSFVEKRDKNLINLTCNLCGSHVQQQDENTFGVITKNCSSFLWLTICNCCGVHLSRRTRFVPYYYAEDEITAVTVKEQIPVK